MTASGRKKKFFFHEKKNGIIEEGATRRKSRERERKGKEKFLSTESRERKNVASLLGGTKKHQRGSCDGCEKAMTFFMSSERGRDDGKAFEIYSREKHIGVISISMRRGSESEN